MDEQSDIRRKDLQPGDFPRIEWLEPWEPSSDPLHNELMREVGSKHILAGCDARCVGRRQDNDDALFLIEGGPASLAVVHLTWTGKREPTPDFPPTTLYTGIEDWIQNGMRPDHLEYTRAIQEVEP